MELSIIIPTSGQRDSLRETLESIHSQNLGKTQIETLVVCNPGNQQIHRMVSSLGGRFRYMESTVVGANRARNFGASEALGECLLFLDDDTKLPSSQFVNGLVGKSSLADTSAAAGGFYLSEEGYSLPQVIYNTAANLWLLKAQQLPLKRPVMVGGCTFIGAQLFRRSGGFAENVQGAAEEVALSQKLLAMGIVVTLNPRLSVHHQFHGSWRRLLTNAFRHGRAKSLDDVRERTLGFTEQWSLIRRVRLIDGMSWGGGPRGFLIAGLASYYLAVILGQLTRKRWASRLEPNSHCVKVLH